MGQRHSFAIFFRKGRLILNQNIMDSLESSPVIAAVKDENFPSALKSPVEMIFLFGSKILTVKDRIDLAHKEGKLIFIHIDLAEGIARDRAGVEFLARQGADGIISTKPSLLRIAKELGLVTVQRFFVYDSQGIAGIAEMLGSSSPDIIEILPGVIGKIIDRFAESVSVPLIAGGLIETKAEVTCALQKGALAVSTGKEELWYL